MVKKEFTHQEVVEIAKRVVASWESIEERARKFQEEAQTTDEVRELVVKDMRSLAGGEEIYLASKHFLEHTAEQLRTRSLRSRWCVYMIECLDGSIYTGATNNPKRRFMLHRAGRGSKYVRSHGVKDILCVRYMGTRTPALVEESRLKRLSHNEKLLYATGEGWQHNEVPD